MYRHIETQAETFDQHIPSPLQAETHLLVHDIDDTSCYLGTHEEEQVEGGDTARLGTVGRPRLQQDKYICQSLVDLLSHGWWQYSPRGGDSTVLGVVTEYSPRGGDTVQS